MKLRSTSPYVLATLLLTSALLVSPGVAQSNPPPSIKNIVLVHGAWADGSSWEKIVPLLEAKGLHVVCVQNPLTSLADDVAATIKFYRRCRRVGSACQTVGDFAL